MDRFSIILKKPPPSKRKIKRVVKKKPLPEPEKEEFDNRINQLNLTVSLLEQEIKQRKNK
jgi:hypothetical protein